MNKFRDILNAINITLGAGFFGAGATRLFVGDYKTAAWSLFIVAILFIIGYFVERFND